MITKILGILIIAAAGAIAYLVLSEDIGDHSAIFQTQECIQLTPAQQLSQMIEKDFQSLGEQNELPPEWNSIATVEIKMGSTLAKTILGKLRPNFQRTKEGSAHLEVEVMDLPDENNPGLIIQASLFDTKTKNKIYEIGRTYTMNDLNRVKPEAPKAAQQTSTKSVEPAPTTTPAAPKK
ncbi:hypothetical protein D3C87_242190 [compost metagenome]